MARSVLPDPLTRRHLLAGDLDATRARAIADAYLEAERTVEAVAFVEKAGDDDGLKELFEHAVDQGDAFLLRESGVALGKRIDAATWTRLAESAEASGKELYAEEARRQASRLVDRES